MPTFRKINNYELGIWNYRSAVLTSSGSLSIGGFCLGVRIFAAGVDSTVNIDGDNTINIRSNAGVDLNLLGSRTDVTVNWVSGSADVLIEALT